MTWYFLLQFSVGTVSVVFSDDVQSGSPARRLLGFGSANASQLFSLRYAIESIQLVTSLTASGSGYSNLGNSWTIYRGTNTDEDYDSFDSERATELGPDASGYIDLMNASQRTALSLATQSLNLLQSTYTYNFIVINWKRPILVRAQVEWNSTHTLYSKNFSYKSGECGVDSAGDCVTHTNASLWTAPAELVALELNNGGSWARLAQPFRPGTGNSYKVVLAFNPDGLVTASPAGLDTRGSGLRDPADNRMNIPFLALNPIPVKSGQTVHRESYLLHHPTATCVQNDNFIRLDLYYLTDTPTEIRAVDIIGLYERPPRFTTWAPQAFYLDGSGDGPYTFKDWSEYAYLRDFYRLSNTSTTNQALFFGQCGGGFSSQNASCCVGVTVNVTLKETALVDF